MHTSALPFKINDVYQGLAETDGLLLLEPNKLTLQFQTKDSLIGALKSNIQACDIAFDHIHEIEFRKGFFKNTLTLHTADLQLIDQIPGQTSAQLTFIIAKKNTKRAFEFASQLRLDVAEHKLMQQQHDTHNKTVKS